MPLRYEKTGARAMLGLRGSMLPVVHTLLFRIACGILLSAVVVSAPFQVMGLLLVSAGFAASQGADEQSRLLERANASYAGRRPLEAVQLYREYLAHYPDRADVRVFLGAALFNLKKPDEALEETRRALSLDKHYALAYVLEGRIYAEGGHWEMAQQAFGAALRLNPRDRETWYFSGRAYYDENRFDKAVEAFERSVALGNGQSRVYESLGLASEALGHFAEAEQAYRHAVQLSAGEYRPYLAYGAFLDKQGRAAESIEMLKKALALAPEIVDTRFELGQALYQSAELAGAAQVLEPALAISNECRVHNLLLSIYSQQERSDDAKRQVRALESCRNDR
jgi:tetratricopeptide (TPR) repeat protein